MKRALIVFVLFLIPWQLVAAESDQALQSIFAKRADLQAAFDKDGETIPGSHAGWLMNLEDWARQYGWREHTELASYAPSSAYAHVSGAEALPFVTADAYLILDRNSGLVLAEHGATVSWPIASLTKLMTANLVLESTVDLSSLAKVNAEDDVGGAKLYVDSGSAFTVSDLLYATLVGSANNAANALSRTTGMDRAAFVAAMNTRAKALGLDHTTFADPTGIDPANVSTAREMAALASAVFSREDMRRYTSTASRFITAASQGIQKKIINTNWMIWKPEYDDIFVMAGKTGYLEESQWNLVVSLRPELADAEREVLIVLFGADSRASSFQDAEALARWSWRNFMWE